MLRKIFLPVIFAILAYGFWISPNFQIISGGVAVFLFGMISLEESFKAFTGGTLETLLRRTTDKLWKSISFGIVTTSIMQSSSLVSVITISFLSAGLIGLASGIGIIFGANLGTTTGAWIVAGLGLKVNIASYAMPVLVFGVILVFQSSKILKGIGYGLAGLGFLFLGIHFMKEGFEAFKDTINLADYAVGGYWGLFLFSLVGVAATVIMQSSHATLVLIITALASQQITYDNALALAIGANIGTTITALLGAIGANIEGKRLAVAHLIFNTMTALIAIILLPQLMTSVDKISNLLGIEANDFTLKLAIFHTLFNLLGLVLMAPFINKLVIMLERFVRLKKAVFGAPKYLNNAVLEIPDAAVETVRKEIVHLYQTSFNIIAAGIAVPRTVIESDRDLGSFINMTKRISAVDVEEYYEQHIKTLYSAIIEFMSRLQAQKIPEYTVSELYNMRQASREIVEAVKGIKHLRSNLERFAVSSNTYIRDEYNIIRLELATILRKVARMAENSDDTDTILSLDTAKVQLREHDRRVNTVLTDLIHKQKISAYMATSLMNDSAYTYAIGNSVINLAQSLFGKGERTQKDAELKLILDEADIDEVIENK
jgi:phosphate:Na+ symporter